MEGLPRHANLKRNSPPSESDRGRIPLKICRRRLVAPTQPARPAAGLATGARMSSSRPAARPKGRPEPAGPRARPLPPARRAAGRRPPVRRSHGRTQLAPPRARPVPAARRAGGRCPPVRTQAPGEAIRALSTGGTYLHRRLARQYNTRPEGSGQRREPTSIGGLGPRSGRRYDKWRPSFCTGARATRGPLEHARNDRDIRLRLLGVTQE